MRAYLSKRRAIDRRSRLLAEAEVDDPNRRQATGQGEAVGQSVSTSELRRPWECSSRSRIHLAQPATSRGFTNIEGSSLRAAHERNAFQFTKRGGPAS